MNPKIPILAGAVAAVAIVAAGVALNPSPSAPPGRARMAASPTAPALPTPAGPPACDGPAFTFSGLHAKAVQFVIDGTAAVADVVADTGERVELVAAPGGALQARNDGGLYVACITDGGVGLATP